MNNKLKPLFAFCILLTTCFSLFSFANSNNQIVENNNIIVTEGKDLKELNLFSDSNVKKSGFFISFSTRTVIMAWDF